MSAGRLGTPAKPARIGLLAHEFLINTGANDLLCNIIRGLSHEGRHELYFLCPPALDAAGKPETDQEELSRHYGLYAEAAATPMTFVPCAGEAAALREAVRAHALDLLMPSIHVFDFDTPYVTYWPDCQPKHFPEFFDDESQKARDARILGLLASDQPMMINSSAAKRDMIEFYNANPDQVFNLPFAPISNLESFMPRPELVGKYRLPKTFFMISNQWWIHKSVETVLLAVREIADTHPDLMVFFTGRMSEPRRPGYIEGLLRMIEELGIAAQVRLLGLIPKRDQIEMMKYATAVIQPTLFEGGPGGGAVYDALSLGVRCIVSDLPVNRELPRNGLISFFPARDHRQLAARINGAINTPYRSPASEDLYQASRRHTENLSKALTRIVSSALSGEGFQPAARSAGLGVGEAARGGVEVARLCRLDGFYPPEPDGIWSSATRAVAAFKVRDETSESGSGLRVAVSAAGFNHYEVSNLRIGTGTGADFVAPLGVWTVYEAEFDCAPGPEVRITLEVDALAETGAESDRRRLGVFLQSVRIISAAA